MTEPMYKLDPVCRVCDDAGYAVKLSDGSVVYECPGDQEQTEGLARLIAVTVDRPELYDTVYRAAVDAIRRANR